MTSAPWVGIWCSEALGTELVLAADGTFGIVGPQGRVTGHYRLQGDGLWLQDESGSVWPYRIVGLHAQGLRLVDPAGTTLEYVRTEPVSLARGRVLAEAGGQRLTEGEVEVGMDLVRLLIDGEPTEAEIGELTQASIEDFGRDPVGFMGQIHQLASSLGQVRRLATPVQVGLARQGIFVSLYAAVASVPPHERPPFMRVVLRHVRVLAHDAEAGLLLTDRDVDGVLAYAAFMRELAGQPAVTVDEAERASIERTLVADFGRIESERRQLLCSAGLLWRLVQANWARFDEEQKQALRDEVRASAAVTEPAATEPAATEPVPDEASGEPAASGATINPATWDIMMDISLHTHATALNIIENIGGTGNYWEVV